MREPKRSALNRLRRNGMLNELFSWSDLLEPRKNYASQVYGRRLDATREYVKEWERLADTSKAKFKCLEAVERRGMVTSLWAGVLPSGQELLIVSIDRRPGVPQYDRGFIDRNEALEFFSRYQEVMA